MSNVIQMPKRNIQHASIEQLMTEWTLWGNTEEEEKPDGVEFHYQQIHAELNRRGYGAYCAV